VLIKCLYEMHGAMIKIRSCTFETKFQVVFPSSALNNSVQQMCHSCYLLPLTETRARHDLFITVPSINAVLINAASTQKFTSESHNTALFHTANIRKCT